jgi:hypothetical protein
MAKVHGTFRACVDPGLFSMTYICKGTAADCSLITTLPGLTCTVDKNKSTICSDGFTCPSSGVQFTTKTQFDLAGSDFSFSKSVQSETCEWALSQDKGSTDVSASSTGSSCGADNAAASAALRQIYSPPWLSLIVLLAILFLVLPASATPTPSVSCTEVTTCSNEVLDGVLDPRTADNNRDLTSRALPEEIAAWKRYWNSYTKPQPWDPEKLYKIFRSMTVRETVRAGLSAADWSMIAEDAWAHLSSAVQNAACRQILGEVDNRAWKNHVVGPITKEATQACVKSVKLRAMAAAKDPKKYFDKFKPTRGTAALLTGAFVACDAMVNLAVVALFSTMAPQLKLLPSSMCDGACFDDSYKRLTDAANCGKCGIKVRNLCSVPPTHIIAGQKSPPSRLSDQLSVRMTNNIFPSLSPSLGHWTLYGQVLANKLRRVVRFRNLHQRCVRHLRMQLRRLRHPNQVRPECQPRQLRVRRHRPGQRQLRPVLLVRLQPAHVLLPCHHRLQRGPGLRRLPGRQRREGLSRRNIVPTVKNAQQTDRDAPRE